MGICPDCGGQLDRTVCANSAGQTGRITNGRLNGHTNRLRRRARQQHLWRGSRRGRAALRCGSVRLFNEQGHRLILALAGVGAVMPHDIAAAFDWHAETRLFIRTVPHPQLLAIATTAATVQLQLLRAGKSSGGRQRRHSTTMTTTTVEGELPENMQTAIRIEVEATLREPYWHRIADHDTREIVQDAIDNRSTTNLAAKGADSVNQPSDRRGHQPEPHGRSPEQRGPARPTRPRCRHRGHGPQGDQARQRVVVVSSDGDCRASHVA